MRCCATTASSSARPIFCGSTETAEPARGALAVASKLPGLPVAPRWAAFLERHQQIVLLRFAPGITLSSARCSSVRSAWACRVRAATARRTRRRAAATGRWPRWRGAPGACIHWPRRPSTCSTTAMKQRFTCTKLRRAAMRPGMSSAGATGQPGDHGAAGARACSVEVWQSSVLDRSDSGVLIVQATSARLNARTTPAVALQLVSAAQMAGRHPPSRGLPRRRRKRWRDALRCTPVGRARRRVSARASTRGER